MFVSCLFSSDKSSVWDPKHIKELLCIPEDQLNQLHNIPVWSKDISNSQDKDKAESSVQNSQCFGLESQLRSTKSKENQDICLKNSVSFNQHSQCQNLQASELYRSKIKSLSLSDLYKADQDLLNIKHTLSVPNICRKLYSSKTYFNKTFTCNPNTNTRTMEVIAQLDIDVSTHVKKGEANFEIIQKKHEEFGDRESAVNADEINNKSETAEKTRSIQEEESNSPTTSCDKMELDHPTCIKEIVTKVGSFSDENESLRVNAEKCNEVVEENAAAATSCDKIESDLPIAEPTVSNVESFQDKNREPLQVNEEESDPPIAEPTVSNVESFQDKNQQPLHVNEETTNVVEVNAVTPTLCDKVDPNAKEAVTDNASTNDKTNVYVNEEKSNETAKLDISAASSCDKMESDFSGVKQTVTENTSTSTNKHELHLESQNVDEKQEMFKQSVESSNNIIIPKEQSAEINIKKNNAPEANQDLCNLGVIEKPITNMPCQEFATSNVPNETPVAKTVGKKRKLETKSKISKKRKSQEKHGQVDSRNRVPGDIHYSLEEIETLLGIIKQFL